MERKKQREAIIQKGLSAKKKIQMKPTYNLSYLGVQQDDYTNQFLLLYPSKLENTITEKQYLWFAPKIRYPGINGTK